MQDDCPYLGTCKKERTMNKFLKIVLPLLIAVIGVQQTKAIRHMYEIDIPYQIDATTFQTSKTAGPVIVPHILHRAASRPATVPHILHRQASPTIISREALADEELPLTGTSYGRETLENLTPLLGGASNKNLATQLQELELLVKNIKQLVSKYYQHQAALDEHHKILSDKEIDLDEADKAVLQASKTAIKLNKQALNKIIHEWSKRNHKRLKKLMKEVPEKLEEHLEDAKEELKEKDIEI